MADMVEEIHDGVVCTSEEIDNMLNCNVNVDDIHDLLMPSPINQQFERPTTTHLNIPGTDNTESTENIDRDMMADNGYNVYYRDSDIPTIDDNGLESFLENDSSSYDPFLDLLETSNNPTQDTTILMTKISSNQPIIESYYVNSSMNSTHTSSLSCINNADEISAQSIIPIAYNTDMVRETPNNFNPSIQDILEQPCLETLSSFGTVAGNHHQFVDTCDHNLFQPNQLISNQPTYQNLGSSVERGSTSLNLLLQPQVQQPCYASSLPVSCSMATFIPQGHISSTYNLNEEVNAMKMSNQGIMSVDSQATAQPSFFDQQTRELQQPWGTLQSTNHLIENLPRVSTISSCTDQKTGSLLKGPFASHFTKQKIRSPYQIPTTSQYRDQLTGSKNQVNAHSQCVDQLIINQHITNSHWACNGSQQNYNTLDQGHVSNLSELHPWTAFRENHAGWKSTAQSYINYDQQATSHFGDRCNAELVNITLNKTKDSALPLPLHFPENPSSLREPIHYTIGNDRQPNQVPAIFNQGPLALNQARAVGQNQVSDGRNHVPYSPFSQTHAVLSIDRVREALNLDHHKPLMLNQQVPVVLNEVPGMSNQVSASLSQARIEMRRHNRGSGSGQGYLNLQRRGRPRKNQGSSRRSEELNPGMTSPFEFSIPPVRLAPPGYSPFQ